MDKDKCLDIFERYISKQASTEEIASLCSFIHNDPHLNNWLESQISNSSSTIDMDLKMEILYNIRSQTNYQIPNNNKLKQTNKHYIRWIANIAAILLPIVLTISIYMYYKPQPVDYLIVSAGLGEKASIDLPDGSKVAINAASEIEYSTAYNKKERTLRLQGEAYFEVEPNPSKPFIVQCNDIKIKVLGTTFGINAYDDDNTISIVLNTGKIELTTPNKTITMLPNEKATYNRTTKELYTEQVDASDYIGWRYNRLRFENETLENIIKTISRMHNTDIVFEDAQLIKQKFTGTIDNTSVQSALKVLSLTAPIDYHVKDGVIFLYKDKDKTQYYK
ncbi:FecR family protein [Parabacteroides sp. Marseille-P3160]|uniref:FecR family protein n=1 Tax=Parabacteroides sp. Marseille-P3160 TaxID=1917887 RepID=UPI0009BC04F0|nr:FecR domain-containing protein [Parabacteroides sp. Marseille-P3160]